MPCLRLLLLRLYLLRFAVGCRACCLTRTFRLPFVLSYRVSAGLDTVPACCDLTCVFCRFRFCGFTSAALRRTCCRITCSPARLFCRTASACAPRSARARLHLLACRFLRCRSYLTVACLPPRTLAPARLPAACRGLPAAGAPFPFHALPLCTHRSCLPFLPLGLPPHLPAFLPPCC